MEMAREVGITEGKAEAKRIAFADAEGSTFDSAALVFAIFFSFLTKNYFQL